MGFDCELRSLWYAVMDFKEFWLGIEAGVGRRDG